MKEELTTKMDSEFSVSKETDVKHRCFCALKDIQSFSYSTERVCALYNVSPEQIERYKAEFLALSSK